MDETKTGQPMDLKQCLALLRGDLHRMGTGDDARALLQHLALEPGFRTVVLTRLTRYLSEARRGRPALLPLYLAARLLRGQAELRYGISVPPTATVGPGLYIGHYGGIFVHPEAVIGKNCNLSQGVTIGQSNRGERRGIPVLGDNVYVGPGAKIFGAVRIGNDVAIGANAVVTCDLPDFAVAVGVPARVVSLAGAEGYINHRV